MKRRMGRPVAAFAAVAVWCVVCASLLGADVAYEVEVREEVKIPMSDGIEISSSNFPRFDRNPNTGHAFGTDAELQKATQTVFHDAKRASHILLPVIP